VKALTILRPFADLICLPESDRRHKRVENRGWPCPPWLIGQDLAIHAGAGRRYSGYPVDEWCRIWGVSLSSLPFGAVVAVANVVADVYVDRGLIQTSDRQPLPPELLWLKHHQHCHGPHGWVLANVRPLPRPLPWKGAQGLWNIPDEAIAKAMEVQS
jgi:hypothetical protein